MEFWFTFSKKYLFASPFLKGKIYLHLLGIFSLVNILALNISKYEGKRKVKPCIFQPMSSEKNHKHLCFYSQMEGFLSDLQAVCEFQEPILFRSSEKGATMCNELIRSVLLTKDQIDPTSMLTAYLEDKNFDSRVPKSINNTNWQYRLYPKNLSWGVLASKLQVWGRVMLSAFFFFP